VRRIVTDPPSWMNRNSSLLPVLLQVLITLYAQMSSLAAQSRARRRPVSSMYGPPDLHDDAWPDPVIQISKTSATSSSCRCCSMCSSSSCGRSTPPGRFAGRGLALCTEPRGTSRRPHRLQLRPAATQDIHVFGVIMIIVLAGIAAVRLALRLTRPLQRKHDRRRTTDS
jgi:hypothetical protein